MVEPHDTETTFQAGDTVPRRRLRCGGRGCFTCLGLRRRVGAKHQDPSAQARVRAGDRLRMIKMDAVKPPQPQPDLIGMVVETAQEVWG